MRLDLTHGAYRALRDAAPDSTIRSETLLMHLLEEPECRAANWLAGFGITPEIVRDAFPIRLSSNDGSPTEEFQCHVDGEFVRLKTFSASLAGAILSTRRQCRLESPQTPLATEHLLLALALDQEKTAPFFLEHGIDPLRLYERIMGGNQGQDMAPVLHSVQEQAKKQTSPTIYRIIDAAANRAMEGIRVIEDYVRFVMDDAVQTKTAKEIRHDLSLAIQTLPNDLRLVFRDTACDIGTVIQGKQEYSRLSPDAVLKANFSRLQESLRSLEEYGKILQPEFSQSVEQIRYRSYTLEKTIFHLDRTDERLSRVRLYALLDVCESNEAFVQMAEAIIRGGVGVIQLRDKHACDRLLLERGRLLRRITHESQTLFIMNDRPDLAILTRADGVHVGQEEPSVHEIRSLTGPKMLIGLSTHSPEQVRQAAVAGADYIGVGPVFPSRTKSFDSFPGLSFLREVRSLTRLPAFAIGGIDLENLPQVLATGIGRIAVQSALTGSPNPEHLAGQLCRKIQEFCE